MERNPQLQNAPPPTRFQVCTKTVMDTTDTNISFDENGICNYWHEYATFASTLPPPEKREAMLQAMLRAIKSAGAGEPYDCVLGLSGGVDSSYLAYLCSKWGLRPLVVHFDNGWNSELAVSNIEKLVSKFGYDLETFVMDWEEFRDLQRAYFKASVLDLEIPTDHMIFGALNQIASKNKIKFIISGHNHATEWLLPKSWNFSKFDLVNLKTIHKTFGEHPLRKLPALGVWQAAYYYYLRGIRQVAPLDLIDYRKSEAKRYLMTECGWRDYGGKHHESIFTRFYQGYILPRKFGIDKRKAHLSNLIITGEITREEALRELQQPTYDEELQKTDKAFVAKKLGFAVDEFEDILNLPNRPHTEFGTDEKQRAFYFKMTRVGGPVRRFMTGRNGAGA
jgi:N-acetyl sugar amidotransferase